MSPWLEICRGAVEDIRRLLAELPTRGERGRVVGLGKGGDDTSAIDQAAEQAIIARLEGEDVRIVSEEVGHKGDGRYTVVVDPIDGSQNAERGIPYFCTSVAVAEGETIEDVVFGYVYDFGANEEWTAVRDGGAFLNGEPLRGAPNDSIQFLSIEATRAALVADRLPLLAPLTDRVRIMGAQALTLCHLAAGRTDAVVCLRPSRSVDVAASQLLVRECGLAIEMPDAPPIGAAPLDLRARSRIVAAASSELCARLAEALRS